MSSNRNLFTEKERGKSIDGATNSRAKSCGFAAARKAPVLGSDVSQQNRGKDDAWIPNTVLLLGVS